MFVHGYSSLSFQLSLLTKPLKFDLCLMFADSVIQYVH